MSGKSKASYGIDAPGVIRNLFIGAAACFIVSIFFPVIKIGKASIDVSWLFWSGIYIFLSGFLMLLYSLIGKYAHRNRILRLINWRGDEQVLDIGTGKGLLMIGAARKLTTGKSTGIDIWNEEDLTGNNVGNALKNAAIEGVADKIEIRNENAMKMSFADHSFDAILSNLCIHNIYNKEGRLAACKEIARVLKNGGTGVISDYRHTKEYKRNFDELGLQTTLLTSNFLTTFPPLRILIIKKPI